MPETCGEICHVLLGTIRNSLPLSLQAFDCVASGAVEIAAHLLNQMLACCDSGMMQRLKTAHAAFAIIGRHQV